MLKSDFINALFDDENPTLTSDLNLLAGLKPTKRLTTIELFQRLTVVFWR